jgi:hypothetical protein
MDRLKSDKGQLFYEFRLGDVFPEDHLVRKIDAALDLSWRRSEGAAVEEFLRFVGAGALRCNQQLISQIPPQLVRIARDGAP